jgi:hypothetical protein
MRIEREILLGGCSLINKASSLHSKAHANVLPNWSKAGTGKVTNICAARDVECKMLFATLSA